MAKLDNLESLEDELEELLELQPIEKNLQDNFNPNLIRISQIDFDKLVSFRESLNDLKELNDNLKNFKDIYVNTKNLVEELNCALQQDNTKN